MLYVYHIWNKIFWQIETLRISSVRCIPLSVRPKHDGEQEKKEEIWLNPTTNPPYQQKILKSKATTQNTSKNFGHTTIVDQPRTAN